jgi:hypothetical protein
MNTWDQDLLFGLSYALLRRFAVIEIPTPDTQALMALVGETEPLPTTALADAVEGLAELPHAPVGPAVVRSAARFLKERSALALEDEDADDWILEAVQSEVLAQIAHLSPAQLGDVALHLSKRVFADVSPASICAFLEAGLGVPIDLPTPVHEVGGEP